MKKNFLQCVKLLVLAGSFPFIYGCGSDGGSSSLSSFLFGSEGITGGAALLSGAAADAAVTGGTELATLHQPEPASMLLLGAGLMAMSYFGSKINRRK